MDSELSLDPARTALMAMDCQSSIVSVYIKDAGFIERASNGVKTARSSGVQVIHIQVGFRPGFPEIGSRNQVFAALKESPERQKMFEGAAGAVHPALGPEPGDISITKHRVSAFHGTDLDMILRAKEIDTLVLFGIATSGVVLSTLLHAFDADYRVLVISDCCADLDQDLHASLMTGLFPKRGDVITSAGFVAALARR